MLKYAVIAGGAFVFACVCGATAITAPGNIPGYEADVTGSGETHPDAPEQLADSFRCWIMSSGCNQDEAKPIDEGEGEIAGGCVKWDVGSCDNKDPEPELDELACFDHMGCVKPEPADEVACTWGVGVGCAKPDPEAEVAGLKFCWNTKRGCGGYYGNSPDTLDDEIAKEPEPEPNDQVAGCWPFGCRGNRYDP